MKEYLGYSIKFLISWKNTIKKDKTRSSWYKLKWIVCINGSIIRTWFITKILKSKVK